MSSHCHLSSATAATADQTAKWPTHESLNHIPVHTPIQRCPESSPSAFHQQTWSGPIPTIATHLNGFSQPNNIYRPFLPQSQQSPLQYTDAHRPIAHPYYMNMASPEESKLHLDPPRIVEVGSQWLQLPPPPPPPSTALTLPIAGSPSKNPLLGVGTDNVWRRPTPSHGALSLSGLPRNHLNSFSGSTNSQPSPTAQQPISSSPSPVLVVQSVSPQVSSTPSPRSLPYQHLNVPGNDTANSQSEPNSNLEKRSPIPLQHSADSTSKTPTTLPEHAVKRNEHDEPKKPNGDVHLEEDKEMEENASNYEETKEEEPSEAPIIEVPQAQYLSVLHYEPRQLSELSAAHAAQQLALKVERHSEIDEGTKRNAEVIANHIDNDFDNSPSSLLLNFSQQSITAAAISAVATAEQNRMAALRIEEKIASEARGYPLPSPIPISSSSFCRPPGHGPTTSSAPTTTGQQPMVCPICGFSCNSKFHYNSHMNTHGDHQCTMCDYTSRTEGRLKKHMRDSHTVEQQIAAGLDIEQGSNSSSNNEPPPTMVEAPSLSMTDPTPSALDHIRALTEKANLIPEASLAVVSTLASALGVSGQPIVGLSTSTAAESLSQAVATAAMCPSGSGGGEPRRSSGGKPKTYKCKQCTHISVTKEEQWAHARTHIPVEKQLACPQCDFVTEYKHHLEYHLRNHYGSKPFQCKKCAYACVNKSMLNSHMKSHTNVYQFRCSDCTYATKYCHSLKLHLRKYAHRRVPDAGGDDSMRMSDPLRLSGSLTRSTNDGSASPMQSATTLPQTLASIINPIVTSQSFNYASQVSQAFIRQQQQMTQMELMRLNAELNCSMCDYKALSREEMVTHLTLHLNNHPLAAFYMQSFPQLPIMPTTVSGSSSDSGPRGMSEEHLDRSGSEDHELSGHSPCEGSGQSSGSPMESDAKASGDEACSSGGRGLPNGARKRKAKAFKLDQIAQRLQGKSSPIPDGHPYPEVARTVQEPDYAALVSQVPTVGIPEHSVNVFQHLISTLQQERQRQEDIWRFVCTHCKMAFQDQALYHIHMGYHGFDNPFKCNRCGHVAENCLHFNLHLWQAKHD